MVNLSLKMRFIDHTDLVLNRSVSFYRVTIFDLIGKEKLIEELKNIMGIESVLIAFYKGSTHVICRILPLIGTFDGLNLYVESVLSRSFPKFKCTPIKAKVFNKFIDTMFQRDENCEFIRLCDSVNERKLLGAENARVMQVINLIEIIKLWIKVKKLVISNHCFYKIKNGTKYTIHAFGYCPEYIEVNLDVVIDEVVNSFEQLKYYKRPLEVDKSVFKLVFDSFDDFEFENKRLTDEKIKASFDLVEFKDGVYRISSDTFHTHADLPNPKVRCWRFANENYLDLVPKDNPHFIKYVKNKSSIDTIEKSKKKV